MREPDHGMPAQLRRFVERCCLEVSVGGEDGADQHVGGGASDDAEHRAAPPQLQRDGDGDREHEAGGAAGVVEGDAAMARTTNSAVRAKPMPWRQSSGSSVPTSAPAVAPETQNSWSSGCRTTMRAARR